MSKKIILTADSPCDLDSELIERFDIKIIPLHIIIDEKDYLDGIDISTAEIFRRYKTDGKLPKTSAISVGEYIAFFRQWLSFDTEILHISLSSGVSSSYQNALIASNILVGNVTCYDTHSLSSGMGLFVVKAGEMIREGLKSQDIIDRLEMIREKTSISFIIDTMEYLKAGGRCSALAAMGANMLKIHPCIAVDPAKGVMGVVKKYRGDYNNILKQYIKEQLSDLSKIDPSIIFITYPDTESTYIETADKTVRGFNYFKEIHHTSASSTISSHCGPNTLGVIFSFL